MSKNKLGWHFLKTDKRLGYEDGRLVAPGETLSVDCELRLCNAGLHDSVDVLDALQYAPGSMLCRTKLSDEIITSGDKRVAQHRKCLWMIDTTDTLGVFARWCAWSVRQHWDMPEVVKLWLTTGDEQYRGEARSAAYSAAYSAADSAADSVADSAASYAARSATYSAASSAANSVAYSVARQKQSRKLTKLVHAEHGRAGEVRS
jgi:hypothetical protein